MKILVTGATGFVGAHLCRRFLAEGADVIATHRKGSRLWRLKTFAPKARLIRMDMRDALSVRKVLRKIRPEIVVNCAAYGVSHRQTEAAEAIKMNIQAVSDLVWECAGAKVKKLIHLGTSLEYGSAVRATEDSPVQPKGLYAVTKTAGSALVLQEGRKAGLSVLVLRPFWMWGAAEEDSKVVPQVMLACLKKRPIKLTVCDQARDYMHVSDAAAMIAKAAHLKKLPEERVLNVASGEKVVLKDFLKRVARVLGGEHLLRFGALKSEKKDRTGSTADTKRLKKYLGEIRSTQKLFSYQVEEAAELLRRGSAR